MAAATLTLMRTVQYPSHRSRANFEIYETPVLDLHLTILDDVSSKINDNCDKFDFDIVNFSFKKKIFLVLHLTGS